MVDVQLRRPKRRAPDELASQQAFKKLRRSLSSDLTPAFWDNLSKIHLTRSAIEELDRRNTGRCQKRRSCKSSNSHRLRPANTYLCSCGPTILRKIKQSARHGGPDIADLIDFREPYSSKSKMESSGSSRSSSCVPRRSSTSTSITKYSTSTASTTNTGPYHRNFQQNLIDGGVYPCGYRYPDGQTPAKPGNWEEIQQQLRQPRPSLSPSKFSEENYERFVQADSDALKEQQVVKSVIPIIEGDIQDAKCASGDIVFANLDPLTDGTLKSGKPDIYNGARPEQLDRIVRDELSHHIIPSTQDDLPIAPNFFVAAKGPDGTLAVANRQASYDGALGARCMHSLQSYRREQHLFDNSAATITSIYHGGTLKMFTSYPSEGRGDQPEYFMHQLGNWGVTGNVETYRQGVAAYRNGRDWAKRKRDEAIRRANERAVDHFAETLPNIAGSKLSSDCEATSKEQSRSGQQTPKIPKKRSEKITAPRDPSRTRSRPGASSKPSRPLDRFQKQRCDDKCESDDWLSEHEVEPLKRSGLSQRSECQLMADSSQSSSDELQQNGPAFSKAKKRVLTRKGVLTAR